MFFVSGKRVYLQPLVLIWNTITTNVGNISIIMRTLTSKVSDLSSYFDKLGKNEIGGDGNNILNQLLIINHERRSE